MILHTVNKSPDQHNCLESCLRVAQSGSGILLLEDGVVAALAGGVTDDALTSALTGAQREHTLYVLGPDLDARGLGDRELIPGIRVVDYGGFVDLVAEHHTVQAWL